MNIHIKTTNVMSSEALLDYVNKRLQKIANLVGNDPSIQCDVELAKTTSHHNKGDIFRAEIHIVGPGKNIYDSAEKSDLYAAIDEVRDGVLNEITSKMDKDISLVRRGGAKVKAMMRGMWPWRG
jgi:ribosomal subunit interface protein